MLNKQEELVLKEATGIKKILEMPEFNPFLQWLTDKLNQSYPDPTTFTKDEEFLYAAKYASTYKKIIGEILGKFNEYENDFQLLTKKKDAKPMGIGRQVSDDE